MISVCQIQSAEDRPLDPLTDLAIEALSVTNSVILQYVLRGGRRFTHEKAV